MKWNKWIERLNEMGWMDVKIKWNGTNGWKIKWNGTNGWKIKWNGTNGCKD
jgi:hypothetical protein